MLVRNATIDGLELTLKEVNKKYDSNVIFNRYPEQYGNQIRFTLRVKDSKKAGHKLGSRLTSKGNHRRLTSACWHVHGDFFGALFDICPDATINARGFKITQDCGNWEDRNIGSIMQPMYFSEACDCY